MNEDRQLLLLILLVWGAAVAVVGFVIGAMIRPRFRKHRRQVRHP